MDHWAGLSCPRSARSLRCWWRKRLMPTRGHGPTSCTASPPPTAARWAWTPLLTPPTPATHHGTLGPLREGQEGLRPLGSTTNESGRLRTGKSLTMQKLETRNGHQMLTDFCWLDCKYDKLLPRFQPQKTLNQSDFGGVYGRRRQHGVDPDFRFFLLYFFSDDS